jgi:hypothetical protein
MIYPHQKSFVVRGRIINQENSIPPVYKKMSDSNKTK